MGQVQMAPIIMAQLMHLSVWGIVTLLLTVQMMDQIFQIQYIWTVPVFVLIIMWVELMVQL